MPTVGAAELAVVRRRLAALNPLLDASATQHKLSALDLRALVAQESRGAIYAIRPEPALHRTLYNRPFLALLPTLTPEIRRWLDFPNLASASYGLGQILWTTALLIGARPRYPTDLLEPGANLHLTATYLATLLREQHGDLTAALGAYNGDRTGAYAAAVLTWRTALST